MKSKILTNLPREEYEGIKAVNQSILKWFDKTPAHAKEYIDHPPPPTPALEFGQVVHTAVLEPRKFYQTYVVMPQVDRRTKDGKMQWAKFEAENPDKIPLKAQDFYQCTSMITSCKNHYTVSQLLYGKGKNELTVVWKDPDTDLLCKCRIDRLTKFHGWTCLIDFKSTRSAQSFAFSRQVAEMNWHLQAAFYKDALDIVAPSEQDRRFIWVAAEKKPPYACRPFELDNSAYEEGRDKYKYFLQQYKQCIETDKWQGYPDEIELLELPAYAVNNYYEFEESEDLL